MQRSQKSVQKASRKGHVPNRVAITNASSQARPCFRKLFFLWGRGELSSGFLPPVCQAAWISDYSRTAVNQGHACTPSLSAEPFHKQHRRDSDLTVTLAV